MLFRNKKLALIRILKLLSPMPSKKRPMQSNPFKIKMPEGFNSGLVTTTVRLFHYLTLTPKGIELQRL